MRVFNNRGDRGLTYIKMKVGVVRARWGRETPSAGPATLGFAINKGVKVGVG